MSKPLHDVVKDVETMLDGLSNGKDVPLDEAAVVTFGEAVADKIRNAFKARHRTPRPKDRIAPSEMGESCSRKLWYSRQPEHVEPDEKMEPHTYVKFMYGDILEELVLLLVHHAGGKVSNQQKEIALLVRGGKIRGYIDAIVNDTLVDVKSSSNYGFKKFKEGLTRQEDTFGYLGQLDSYATGLNTGEKGFLVINKETGKIIWSEHRNTPRRGHDVAIDETTEVAVTNLLVEDKAIELLKAVNLKDAPVAPDALHAVPHGKKNSKLCTKCSYCQYKVECYKESNDGFGLRKFIYSNGPIWLTDVGDPPRVPEVPVPKKGVADGT